MKKHRLFGNVFILLFLGFAISCDRGPVYQNYLKMKNSIWDRFDQKFFEIPIEKPGKTYNITFFAKTTADFIYDGLPVYVILTSPSGEERMREVTIKIRAKGSFTGVKTGELWEARTTLWESLGVADIGKCKISIENLIPKIQTQGIDGIGIVVEVAKKGSGVGD